MLTDVSMHARMAASEASNEPRDEEVAAEGCENGSSAAWAAIDRALLIGAPHELLQPLLHWAEALRPREHPSGAAPLLERRAVINTFDTTPPRTAGCDQHMRLTHHANQLSSTHATDSSHQAALINTSAPLPWAPRGVLRVPSLCVFLIESSRWKRVLRVPSLCVFLIESSRWKTLSRPLSWQHKQSRPPLMKCVSVFCDHILLLLPVVIGAFWDAADLLATHLLTAKGLDDRSSLSR